MRAGRSTGIAAVCIGCAAFGVYLLTLAPSVMFIDAGELAAVASLLGIAHPTGYPLFTLLGHIFVQLPVAGEEITRLNMMAALLCASAAGLFFLVMRTAMSLADERTRRKGDDDRGASLIGCTAASLLLAFSETYWAQATSVEVYSLHAFFLSAVLLAFLKAAGATGSGGRLWHLFAFLLGLSFSNHMTTVLLGPGLLYYYLASQGRGRASWVRLATLVPVFLLGLSVYLYLPLRAVQSPGLAWGFPATLERFLWHISGKQYRVWLFTSTAVAGRQLEYFITGFPREFAYAGLVAAAVGAVVLWRLHRRLFLLVALLFAGCVLYAINYDIHDIDSYFLLAYFATALWAGFGFRAVAAWFLRVGWRPVAAGGLVIAAGLAPLGLHYTEEDERQNHLVEDYTMNMFASLAPGALVLSYQWDYWVSASYYYQLVKGYRPDVVVIDKELLRRSWYIKQLGARYPWLIRQSQREVDGFLKEVDKFEHDMPYDPALIQARYEGLIASLIRRNLPGRPVYVTGEIEGEFTRGLQRVPEGLAFRLYGDTLYHPSPFRPFVYRPYPRGGKLEGMVRTFYAEALAARGEYLLFRGGNENEAKNALEMALSFDPALDRARRLAGTIR